MELTNSELSRILILKFLGALGDITPIMVDTKLEAVRSFMPKAHVATVYAKPLGRDQVETFITESSLVPQERQPF